MNDITSQDDKNPTVDWILMQLVHAVNSVEGFSLGVTIQMPGGVVTGILISAREYFQEYGKFWGRLLGDNDVAKAINQQWIEFGNKSMEEAKSNPTLPTHFIHLKDARILSGDRIVPNIEGFLWRGRLSEVAGFGIGTLNISRQGKGP